MRQRARPPPPPQIIGVGRRDRPVRDPTEVPYPAVRADRPAGQEIHLKIRMRVIQRHAFQEPEAEPMAVVLPLHGAGRRPNAGPVVLPLR